MGQTLAIFGIFVGVPLVLVSAYRASLSHQRYMKVLQLKSELNARLLDRVGTDPGVIDLLKSEAQHQMFDVKMTEAEMPMPYSRMLTSIQISCLLLSAGIGAFVLRSMVLDVNDQQGFAFFGTFSIALGVGALLSAGAAFVIGRMLRQAREAS